MHILCHRTAIPCHGIKVKELFKSKRVKSSDIVGGYGIPAIPTQSAVHSYCQCDCHHSIGLYTHVCVGMAGMPYPPTDTHSSVFKKPVLLFFCLFKNNMFSCPHVFKKTCSSVFPPKEPYPPSNPVFMSPKKKRLRATLPAVKP